MIVTSNQDNSWYSCYIYYTSSVWRYLYLYVTDIFDVLIQFLRVPLEVIFFLFMEKITSFTFTQWEQNQIIYFWQFCIFLIQVLCFKKVNTLKLQGLEHLWVTELEVLIHVAHHTRGFQWLKRSHRSIDFKFCHYKM